MKGRTPELRLSDLAAQILAAIDVSALVAELVSIRRVGRELTASCPFHEDRNASLSVKVVDARGHWRCFAGCGAGDLVAFHMRRTGKAFQEAVADLLRRGA